MTTVEIKLTPLKIMDQFATKIIDLHGIEPLKVKQVVEEKESTVKMSDKLNALKYL